MRGFVGFLVFVGVLVAVLVFLVAPALARPLIASLVNDALPFDSESLDIGVEVGPSLLAGEVDAVTIRGRDLQSDNISIGSLELTINGVSTGDRTFRSSEGRLEDAEVRLDDGTVVSITLVELGGPSDAAEATATMDAEATEGLVRAKLAEAGILHDSVRLSEGVVEVSAGGQTVRSTIEVRDDGLFLVADRPLPPLALIQTDPSEAWHVSAATVSSDGLRLALTLDAEALLSP